MGSPRVLPALPTGFLDVDPRTGKPTEQDAAMRAFLLAQAPNASEEQATFVQDFSDATTYGGRVRLIRYAQGALLGGALVGIICWLRGR